ncbi:ATP-binding protein [Campylobacter pinnipediorum]|uniref:ATP-binding protein n=1 Tax=Campylobacter pinnipediorum TaxID=1965231 RepID=UPI0009951139|nr:ATP-binding protein [Campylobacter pinnipediorum]AQW82094.1 AAA domain protein [Campylobacter pinnipediorum subsp. pinnipediorum]
MKKLKIYLENCYGIKKLETEFDFTKKNTYSIYAPNGTMKTSFAKTFKDLSNNYDSKDEVFKERKPIRKITDEKDEDLLPEQVFVIESYNQEYSSDKISTLVVEKELKQKYDKIYTDLDNEKTEFIKKLKSVSQSSDCESEVMETFRKDKSDTFFEILLKINENSNLDINREYNFRYNDVFDQKGNIKKFLYKNKDSLKEYFNEYDSLISKSSFFKKSNNTFGTYQAQEILKSIQDNSFFTAGHALKLNTNQEIKSAEEYEKLIENEIQKIMEDENLKKVFKKIDKAISSNKELRDFKKVLEENNLLLTELIDYEKFKEKVWVSYLTKLKTDVENILKSYNEKKEDLKKIIQSAIDTITEWEDAVNEFNIRFTNMPFRLEIENKDDMILKTSAVPMLNFIFKENENEIRVEKGELLKILSQGEKRALYLLNIIFEIMARKKLETKSLFIVDDIADSFDYKNKYAIIEYLNDISKEEKFYQIILTHNFDFYRTLNSRFVGYNFSKMINKGLHKISIIDAKYIKNPFEYLKKQLVKNEKCLVAIIPFIRNLFEYTSGIDSNEYIFLTSLLHIKENTYNITIQDLENNIKAIFKDVIFEFTNTNEIVIDLIFKLAEDIIKDDNECLNLENKIIMSIAIRLKAEKFMIEEIGNEEGNISNNQTIMLINKYKNKFSKQYEIIKVLEKVNLITPENIHLNSFMYEPILDMSDESLKNLYIQIKELNNPSL